MKPKLKVRSVKSTYELEINAAQIIEWANFMEWADEDTPKIPDNAEVVVFVPGGGDYSGMALDLTARTPVLIRWTVTTEN